MGKMEKGKVRVENTETSEVIEYFATKKPYKANVGHYLCGNELKHTGMKKLQDKGFNIVDDVSLRNTLIGIFNKAGVGLTTDDFGRTPSWNTPEDRAKWKVFVNEVAFEPEFTKKQKAKIEEVEQIIPNVPNGLEQVTPQAVVPQAVVPQEIETPADIQAVVPQVATPQVVIPTLTPQAIMPQATPTFEKAIIPQTIIPPTPEELAYIEKIKVFIAEGKWTKEQLITSLGEKIGVEKATRLYSLAV